MEILKTTAKSAPIPTIAAVIAYTTLPKLVDQNITTNNLIVISTLTFLIIFSLLFYGIASKKEPINSDGKISDNEIKDVESEVGDIFIGDKNPSLHPLKGQISKNKINNAKTKHGDIFIGRKK